MESLETFLNTARSIDPNFDKHPVPDDPGPPIAPETIDRMCDGYFRYHEYIARKYVDLAPQDLTEISDEIMQMADSNPERLWPLLVALIERAPTAEVRGFVAAGALEDLVSWHGERFLDRLEHEAIHSKAFHEALRGIWGWERFPDHVRERLFGVLTPEWDQLEDRRSALL